MPVTYSRPADLAFSHKFKEKINDVYSFFPELQNRELKCGVLKTRGPIQGTATSWTKPPVIRLQPTASLFTIAHELTHLIQGRDSGVPHGEIAFDIWTVDRMPVEYLDQQPFYLLHRINADWKTNKAAIKQLCREAIAVRRTVRTYIQWLRCRIKEL